MSIVCLGVKGYVIVEELDVVQADKAIFPFGCGSAISVVGQYGDRGGCQ